MRCLVLKSLLFAALALVLVVAINWAALKINTPNPENACYLWGDSQMYQGINLAYLNTNSHRKFYSAAQHGAGVYDFLVFTETVPNNSYVVIPMPHMVLVRRKAYDRNVSAINVKALLKLHDNNYSTAEIAEIIHKNVNHLKLFSKTNQLYSDGSFSPNPKEPISLFKAMYSKKPTYFDDKKKLYLEGVKTLIHKNCMIVAVSFPLHPLLLDTEKNSPLHDDFEHFDNDIINILKTKETIAINSKENIFKDYTHLNERGANLLSIELAKILNRNGSKSVIVRHIN